jgi:hypothetical protein
MVTAFRANGQFDTLFFGVEVSAPNAVKSCLATLRVKGRMIATVIPQPQAEENHASKRTVKNRARSEIKHGAQAEGTHTRAAIFQCRLLRPTTILRILRRAPRSAQKKHAEVSFGVLVIKRSELQLVALGSVGAGSAAGAAVASADALSAPDLVFLFLPDFLPFDFL